MRLRSLFLQGAVLLSQLLSMPTFCAAEADAPKPVTEREVIEDGRRATTIYELVPLDPTGRVVPSHDRSDRTHPRPAPTANLWAIKPFCQRKAERDRSAVEDCVEEQAIALHAMTAIKQGMGNDAGLENIVQTCLSESKFEMSYDWQAVKQCYENRRESFTRVYGR
jgi:hypothetical protein